MIRRRISEAQRWQIFGMHTTGMSFKAIGRQMGYHYTVVSRLVRKHTQTNNERLAKIVTTGQCSVWLDGFHSQTVPYSNNTGCPIDVCQQKQLETVWNQRDLVKESHWTSTVGRPTSTNTFGMVLSTTWLEFEDMRKIHWSDESWFLLQVTDGRMRVLRHKHTAYT
jgi:hypothetical protein